MRLPCCLPGPGEKTRRVVHTWHPVVTVRLLQPGFPPTPAKSPEQTVHTPPNAKIIRQARKLSILYIAYFLLLQNDLRGGG